MAWLVCHKSKYIHLQSFSAIGFCPFARDIQKGDWNQRHFFPPWKKTHPFIGKRQFLNLIHEIPKVYCRDICSVNAGGLIQLDSGAWGSGNPPVTLRSQSSCFKPPFHDVLKDISLPHHDLFFYWGLSNLKSLISERYKEIKLWERLPRRKTWKTDFM